MRHFLSDRRSFVFLVRQQLPSAPCSVSSYWSPIASICSKHLISSDPHLACSYLNDLAMAATSADNKGPRVVAAAVSVIVIQVVVVILRFWSRAILVRARFWWDDWMVLAALVSSAKCLEQFPGS